MLSDLDELEVIFQCLVAVKDELLATQARRGGWLHLGSYLGL